MPLLEFVGQTVQDGDNIQANASRLINCHRQLVLGQGKTRYTLNSVLGQDLADDIGAYEVRTMGYGNQKTWLVGNGLLYELAANGVLTSKGSVADDPLTLIDGNYSDVTITAGGNYYVWDGATVSQPANKTFASVGSHCYVGGYTVLTERDGKRFQWSGLADAQTLDALHFASAEQVDDNIVHAIELGGNLVLLGEKSTELWQVTGQSGVNAFARVTSFNRGLKGFHLIARFDNTAMFVGDDNNVYIGFGPGAIDVSTPAINTALENNEASRCIFYEDQGHKFFAITFSDRPAFVFDVRMKEWHERAEGANDGPWRALASVKTGEGWFIGNDDGEVHKLARTNKDLNGPLRRTAISSPLYLGDRKFKVNKVEMNARVGAVEVTEAPAYALDVGGGFALKLGTGQALKVAEGTGAPRAAKIGLQESRDGGNTWGDVKERSLGMSGDYDQRMIWRSRGHFNEYTVRVTIDEPADIPLNTTAVVEVI